ncbi:O-antigen ligase family protein [Clostridium nigeriense]|uniref:O-antigen ligase family protein n=1 Tax=Clostridium nigeriense TaxID=1805470 RepID=UPI003D347FDB
MNVNSLNKNRYWIPIILMLMYFYIGELKNIIYFNSLIWLGSLLFSMILLIKLNGKTFIISKENIAWILVWVFFIVIRNQNIKYGIDYGILYYIFMIIAMILLKKSTKWIDCMIKFLGIVCMIHAIVTILSSFMPSFYFNYIIPIISPEYRNDVIGWYYNGSMAGLASHYSINGMYLAIGTGIISIITVFNDTTKKWKKVTYPTIMMFALLLTGKRAHLVFMIISLSLVYLIYNYKKVARSTIKLILLVNLCILIYLILSIFIPNILVSYDRLFNSDYSTLGGRTQLYEEAIKLFRQSPIIGNGWGAYKNYVQYTVGANYSSEYAKMNAHNIYLQLLCETGVIGFSSFVGLIIYNLRKAIKVIKKLVILNYIPKIFSINALVLLFIQIFFVLYGFTGNPLYDAPMYMPYMLSCAGISSITYKIMKKNIM